MTKNDSPADKKLLVTEIFYSLQGESTLAGIPFVFVRLTGCNLRCSYCDTSYAFQGGVPQSIDEIIEQISRYKVQNVLLTGGEPLLQKPTPKLAQKLTELGYQVSIETHGQVAIESVSAYAKIIFDIKTPSSQMADPIWMKHAKDLKESDEIKFVIASQEDYEWAKTILKTERLPTKIILFSPALAAENTPAPYEPMDPKWLAERILEDALPVRFQLQLHKMIWGLNAKGV